MLKVSCYAELANFIHSHLISSNNKIITVIIGGCSRAGKTTLALNLQKKMSSMGIHALIVQLDAWLVSLEKRNMGSTVLERYETASIVSSIKKLQSGGRIYPPVYDAVSRKRVKESSDKAISLECNEGMVIVEGVVALAIPELMKIATLKIFVDIPDVVRKQRLEDFYSLTKKIDKHTYEKILSHREKEEVILIKATHKNADVLFYGGKI